MQKIASVSPFHVARQYLTAVFFSKSIAIALVYILITLLTSQLKVLQNIFSQPTTLTFKLQISVEYLASVITIYSPVTQLLFFSVALLIGINVMLSFRKLQQLQTQKDVRLTFGIGILSLSSTGCPSCGFSLLSLTGISAASFIPISTFDLSIISVVLLLGTAVYNLHTLQRSYCALPTSDRKNK